MLTISIIFISLFRFYFGESSLKKIKNMITPKALLLNQFKSSKETSDILNIWCLTSVKNYFTSLNRITQCAIKNVSNSTLKYPKMLINFREKIIQITDAAYKIIISKYFKICTHHFTVFIFLFADDHLNVYTHRSVLYSVLQCKVNSRSFCFASNNSK